MGNYNCFDGINIRQHKFSLLKLAKVKLHHIESGDIITDKMKYLTSLNLSYQLECSLVCNPLINT